MIIDSGWVKVSVRDGNDTGEKILAVSGQGDVIGERAALTTQVRSATVTALDEVSAMVVPADRFAEFLRGHPRAVEVLQRQVKERQEEDRARLFPGERAGAERRLASGRFPRGRRPPCLHPAVRDRRSRPARPGRPRSAGVTARRER